MSSVKSYLVLLVTSLAPLMVMADGPKDNLPDQVRPVPPIGVELSEADRSKLTAGLKELNDRIRALRSDKDARVRALLPDVEIFARAIDHGVKYRELFTNRHVQDAHKVLAEGLSRAESLAQGSAPWTTQTGLVVRGFRSRIDRTVQPYGLVIPDTYTFAGKSKYRLDLWFHGRGERSSESVFINERMSRVGRIQPADTIVLHPYGRYSNAFKFAGEVDVLEALAHAKTQYRIDDDRIAVRGFSMGGAGCWQMAVHYPDMFFAATPGAGFSETPEFLKFFQKQTLNPTWFESKLWQLYDCPGYVINLYNLPTIAYSGELDIQKQAADIMEDAAAREGLRLTHIVGAKTKHTIDSVSAKIIDDKMNTLAQRGRDQLPREIRFATYTLKYNRMHWFKATRLREHWKQARVKGRLVPEENRIELELGNITAFELNIPAGRSPFSPDSPVTVTITDGGISQQAVATQRPATDRSWGAELILDHEIWNQGKPDSASLAKRHGLQGPIDDAFMDAFVFVRPSGTAKHAAVDQWTKSELERAVKEWRRQFRGDAIVKSDTSITDDDIANNNLILFGDPASNSMIASIANDLPIKWSGPQITFGKKTWPADHHAPILIYPNPKNPDRYIVINSGFTYREYAYLNNARQVPMLPDWAIIDLRTPPGTVWPGRVDAAGFFNGYWR